MDNLWAQKYAMFIAVYNYAILIVIIVVVVVITAIASHITSVVGVDRANIISM